MNSNVSKILTEVHKVIIGKDEVLEKILMTLLSRGHVLLDDVPGTGKTTAALAFHRALGLRYGRIQFTPDVLPSDIVGFSLYRKETGDFVYQPGAVMTNLLLADEINRTSSKTQAALLEVMEERQVTVDGVTHPLPAPFAVIATQNPVGSAGTQLLPQAQLDRFMFLIEVDYPTEEEEMRIARETTGTRSEELKHILSGEEIIFYQDLVRRVPVPEHIYEYAVKLVRATRPTLETSPEWVKQYVAWGAGPRAVQFLILGAKTRAALQGSYIVRREDIDAIVEPVLMHRVVTNFAAESQGITPRKAVARLAAEI